jgi:hypothetical protein
MHKLHLFILGTVGLALLAAPPAVAQPPGDGGYVKIDFTHKWDEMDDAEEAVGDGGYVKIDFTHKWDEMDDANEEVGLVARGPLNCAQVMCRMPACPRGFHIRKSGPGCCNYECARPRRLRKERGGYIMIKWTKHFDEMEKMCSDVICTHRSKKYGPKCRLGEKAVPIGRDCCGEYACFPY